MFVFNSTRIQLHSHDLCFVYLRACLGVRVCTCFLLSCFAFPLHSVHAHNIAHRDIKPQNILLNSTKDHVKVRSSNVVFFVLCIMGYSLNFYLWLTEPRLPKLALIFFFHHFFCCSCASPPPPSLSLSLSLFLSLRSLTLVSLSGSVMTKVLIVHPTLVPVVLHSWHRRHVSHHFLQRNLYAFM